MNEFVVKYISEESSGRKPCAAYIANQISSGTGTILQVIEALQDELTSSDIDRRIKACEMISDVFSVLHLRYINSKEASALLEFLCMRLKDHYSIHSAALSALLSLSSHNELPDGVVTSVLTNLFREVHTPSYMQSDRRTVYEIVTNLLQNNTQEILKLGNDFLYGVISAVDGEQDPRNLLKVFDLVYEVVQSGIDLSKFAEELFEVVGCYFPIDFEPPPSLTENKQVITNKQLVTALRKVLASTSLFAPYCLPLIVEKIESDVQSAKLDALATLKDCLLLYSANDLRPHLRSLWVCVRREVITTQTKEIGDLGQAVIRDVVAILSKSTRSDVAGSELHSFLNDILEECLPRLTEHLHEKTSWSSAKLLVSAAVASKKSCRRVLPAMVPVLLKHLDEDAKVVVAEKRLAMEILVNVTKTAAMLDFSGDEELHPLAKHKDDIIGVFCGCVSSREFILMRTVALAGIAALCDLGLFIAPDDQLTIVRCVLHCVQNERDTAILNDCMITVGFLASKWPDIAINHILPVLEKAVANGFCTSSPETETFLSYLSAASTHIDITSLSCDFLAKELLSHPVSEKTAPTIQLCLDSLSTIVKRNFDDSVCVSYFAESLVSPLVRVCVELSLVPVLPEQCCSCCSDSQTFSSQCVTLPIMQKVSEILRIICQKVSPGPQADKICKNMADIFLHQNLNSLDLGAKDMSFGPFLYDKLPLQTRLVSLLTATVCSFHKDVLIHDAMVFVEKLMDLCLKTADQPSYVAATKCLAGLLNKQKDPSDSTLEKVFKMSTNLASDTSHDEKRINKFCLLVWVTKALVLRSHPRMMDFAEILLQLFGDTTLGRMSADSFDIILRETEEVLNASSHASIRLMYQQRFFQLILPKLTAGFQNLESADAPAMEVDVPTGSVPDTSATKANYLTALSHLLMYIPKQVLRQHLTTLLPLLMKSLNTEEGPSLVSVLTTLYSLVQEAKSAVEPHVEMLSGHFLRLSVPPFDLKIRMQALKCIGVLTLLPVNVVLPHKKKMVRQLATVLDDKKRLVRKEAVKARTQWCLVGDV